MIEQWDVQWSELSVLKVKDRDIAVYSMQNERWCWWILWNSLGLKISVCLAASGNNTHVVSSRLRDQHAKSDCTTLESTVYLHKAWLAQRVQWRS